MKMIQKHVLWKNLKRDVLVRPGMYGNGAEVYTERFTAAAADSRKTAGTAESSFEHY